MATTHPEPTARQRGERLAFRRGITLLALTLIAPGSAQLIVGGKGLGRFALRIWAGVWALLIGFGLLALANRNAAIAVYAHPFTQWVGSAAVAVLGVGWAMLLLDAWRLSRPRQMGTPRTFWMGVTALALAFTLGFGALQASAVSRSQAQLFSSVFAGGGMVDATDGRYNVLLIGADAEPDRPGIRTDTIMVASVSATTGRTVLFSLPRNLQWAPFPRTSPLHALYPGGYWCEDQSCLLNAVYNLAEQHADLYPGNPHPGMTALREVVSETLGLTLNYHAMIDMRGFEQLIDAMGGVTLDIAKAVPIGGGSARIDGWIQPGTDVHLNGYEALWFARSREGSSDYERMTRQKCVVNAIAKQATPLVLVTRFNEIAAAGATVLTTDVPSSQIGPLAQLADAGRRLPIASVSFAPPLVEPVKPDLTVIRDTVREYLKASVEADRQAAEAAAAAEAEPAEATPAASTDTGATPAPQPTPEPAVEPTNPGTPAVVSDTKGSGTGDFTQERTTDDLDQICGA
ncbi:LCP family protein [Propioniciclava sp.]|uniref:LCP family protein n=1 Tax=Propioniciclava sp. TaxID=2038686 RepID=UPI002608734D|nr:LCP family protein [Propioniciclava sp.]